MLFELSTEQLGLLDTTGEITLVNGEEVIVVTKDSLDIGLDQLAMGEQATTPDGHTLTA